MAFRREKKIVVACDQFGAEVVVDRCYGLEIGKQRTTRAVPHDCIMVLRGRYWFRSRRDRSILCLSSVALAGYSITALDDAARELTTPPADIAEARVAEVRELLERVARKRSKIELAQSAAIHQLHEVLRGSKSDSDLLDDLASFVRDPESHVTIESLIDAFRASLETR